MLITHFRWLRRAVALALFAQAAFVCAAPVKTPHVEAELIAENTAAVPGESTTVALRLRIEDGWHTYWRNPGDTGLPTTIEWKLPAGFRASAIEWPAPKALQVGPLVNYGYEGTVLHLVTLAIPRDAKPGDTAALSARADWLVCKETCIPDGADLKIALPIAERASADAQWSAAFAATRAALPQRLDGGWRAEAHGDGPRIVLTIAPPARASDPGTLRFFANAENQIESSAPQALTRNGEGAYVLTLPVSYRASGNFAALDGVVTATDGFANGNARVKAAAIDVPLTGTIVAGPKPALDDAALNTAAPSSSPTFAVALVLAFAGGLILNLMPCVFPILSLKALSLTTTPHGDRRAARAAGAMFAFGVVLTFVALALLLLALRSAGEQVGWGFQLQSPAVVTGLAILFFVLALNLSGVFEFGSLLPSAATLHFKNRNADALLSGVLAVVVASPCTAPFMGAALGYALAQPTSATLAVFVALGVGMALPFLLLSWFPGWRRVLPRPGAWMVRLKQVLAFPLYATVAWLIWVIGAQVDNDAVVRLLATLLIVAFALWSWRTFKSGAAIAWSFAAVAAFVCAVIVAWPLLLADAAAGAAAVAPANASSKKDSGWLAYTPTRVADLTSSGRAVFVDFTAAWCVTCQVNKRLVLNDTGVRDAFARKNVALVRADWTRRDPTITRALATLGRNGVPVYVLYRPGREPMLLPEVLQAKIIEDALATL